MSFGSDVLKFKLFEGKKILREIRDNPMRMVVGSVDPASTGAWNAATGRHDEAMVDQMGGTTGKTMDEAGKAGINTGPGRKMEGLAHIVAAAIAGGYGVSALGGAGAAPAAGAAPTAGAAEGAGGAMLVDTGGMGMGEIGASQMTPALMESAAGSSGYGASSAGAGGAGGAGKLAQAGRFMQMAGNNMQQPDRPLQQDAVNLPEDGRPYWDQAQAGMVTSSRGAKHPERSARMASAAMQAGASGADPISQNGVQIAAIKALTKRVAHLRQRLTAIKEQRGHHGTTR